MTLSHHRSAHSYCMAQFFDAVQRKNQETANMWAEHAAHHELVLARRDVPAIPAMPEGSAVA